MLAFIRSLDIRAIATEVMYKLFAMLEMTFDFKLSKGDEQVTSDKTWSKHGWKYDIQSKTLTLLGYNMATIGKRINGENDKPERYALIYVEGEQDLNINITGEVVLGDSPFSSQAATKNKKSYSGIYAPDSNITITGDGSLLIVTHEVALYAKKLTISMTAQGQRSVDCESYGPV